VFTSDLYLYLNIFVFSFLSIFVSSIMIILSFIFGFKNYYSEKLSAYECGFNPFDTARRTFDVRFYLVSIVFIVFDVEVILLFPIISSIFFLENIACLSIFIFFLLLVVSLMYEWSVGVLDFY
jgi:NADH-quinone oxidoreductase subunit A